MSAGNTPGHSRRMLVPGIDTHGAFEGHQASPHGLPNSWPMTPPQSALELRRPSLACSSVSDASLSGPSSSCDFSQPATPMQPLGLAGDHFAHSWNMDSTMTTGIAEQCSLASASQAMYNPNLVHSMSGVEMTDYSPTRQFNGGPTYGSHNQSLMRHAWTPAHSAALDFHLDSKPLFGFGQGVNRQTDASLMYADPDSTLSHPSLEPSAFHELGNATMYSPAQVVIPSQINPQEEYSMEHYPDYDDANVSFDSSATSGWDSVGPQSPDGAYCDPSEDDGYVMIKPEVCRTKSPRRSLPGPIPNNRIKRKTSRKSRRSTHDSAWLVERHGFTIRYEGKEWERLPELKAAAKYPEDSKPQICTVVVEDNICGAKFHRSEHLKRHKKMHDVERDFHCPLADCKKAMSRSDNATDHFKTHLKGPGKGKRNKECTLEQLADAMLNNERWGESKKTNKMLGGLEKWYRNFHREQQAGMAVTEDVVLQLQQHHQSRNHMSLSYRV